MGLSSRIIIYNLIPLVCLLLSVYFLEEFPVSPVVTPLILSESKIAIAVPSWFRVSIKMPLPGLVLKNYNWKKGAGIHGMDQFL